MPLFKTTERFIMAERKEGHVQLRAGTQMYSEVLILILILLIIRELRK